MKQIREMRRRLAGREMRMGVKRHYLGWRLRNGGYWLRRRENGLWPVNHSINQLIQCIIGVAIVASVIEVIG